MKRPQILTRVAAALLLLGLAGSAVAPQLKAPPFRDAPPMALGLKAPPLT